jgi:hypothetical protein
MWEGGAQGELSVRVGVCWGGVGEQGGTCKGMAFVHIAVPGLSKVWWMHTLRPIASQVQVPSTP